MMTTPEKQPLDLLREMFPDLSEEQLVEADEKFGRYLELAWRVSNQKIDPQTAGNSDADAMQSEPELSP